MTPKGLDWERINVGLYDLIKVELNVYDYS